MNANALIASGDNDPDDDLVDGPIGMRYFKRGTTIEWVKYGAEKYNWRPLRMDPRDGYIGPGLNGDMEVNVPSTFIVNSGAGTTVINTGLPGRLQIALMTVTLAATPDRTRLFHLGGLALQQGIVPGDGKIYLFGSINIPVLSDGVNNLCYRGLGMDFGGGAAADQSNGVYFENDLSTYGDNRWRLKTADNAARTVQDLGVAPVANTWTRLGIVVAANGLTAQALVNDVKVGAPMGGLPTAGRGFGLAEGIFKTLGAGALTVLSDYVYCSAVCNAGR